LPDDIITLGDEVGDAPELKVGERRAEIGHERLDVVVPAARRVQ